MINSTKFKASVLFVNVHRLSMIYIIHKKKTKIENLINADLDRKSSDDDNESDNETKK